MKNLFLRINIERLLTLGYFSKVPQRKLFYGYLSYIIFGAIILSLPFSQKLYTGFIDNLFTAVSAVSTTGLASVSLADNYTLFGQIVVIILVQFGGIGYMTISSFLVLKITHHLSKNESHILKSEYAIPEGFNIQSLIRGIVLFTFIFEFFGAIALFFTFYTNGCSDPIWKSIFHSISAFCTAGFGLYNDSFEQFKYNININII